MRTADGRRRRACDPPCPALCSAQMDKAIRRGPRLACSPTPRANGPSRAGHTAAGASRARGTQAQSGEVTFMDPRSIAVAETARPQGRGAEPCGAADRRDPARARRGHQREARRALAAQAERGGRSASPGVAQGPAPRNRCSGARAQLELPYQMRVATDEVSQELVSKVPINFAKQRACLPLRMDGDHVWRPSPTRWTRGPWTACACCSAPPSPRCWSHPVDPGLQSTRSTIGEERGGAAGRGHGAATSTPSRTTGGAAGPPRLQRRSADHPSGHSLLFRAAKERASDIHIGPQEKDICVRFRVDGVLQEVIRPPKRFQNPSSRA